MAIKKKTKTILNLGFSSLLTIACGLAVVDAHDELGARPHHIDTPANPTAVMRAFSEGKLGDDLPVQNLNALAQTDCVGGAADGYPCDNVDLGSFMPLSEIGSTQSNDEGNDIWGWTDPLTGDEYAIMGRVFGTSFIDVTDPSNPVFVGELDTHGRFGSSWRDIKVYNNHAFIVSEARRHGMQVFDLTQLRSATPGTLFQETAHYSGFGSAHNIVINEGSGFAYGVGTDKCSGGLAMVNIQDPQNPTNAGCFAADGYTHDAQCVNYSGPDTDHSGKEICLASNEDTLTIVDVTNKSNPVQISRTDYPGAEYTHQGWLTEDQSFFLLDDELDEQRQGTNTLTHMWDVSDLDAPVLSNTYASGTSAIDHNQYIHGNCSFQANYRAGLRILSFDPQSPAGSLSEIGYFDIYPADDASQFNAAWSNYPHFESGTVVVSGIEQGLYVLRPNATVLTQCGLNNAAPVTSITSPADVSTVSGSAVSIAIDASDAEDVNGSLTVEWQVDGGPWNATGYNGSQYVTSWDSTTVNDGSHTITARATDSGGKTTTSASHTVTTDNGVTASTIHLEPMSSSTTSGRGGKWNGMITISVGDAAHAPVDGATVNGSWSNGASGSGSCVTSAGSCTITKNNINRNSTSATFTVTSVTHATLNYDSNDNDAGDSITVLKP